jgi:hypothetical protein
MRTAGIRRAVVPLALAAGLLAPCAASAVASTAADSVSISATDKAGSYWGYTLVFSGATQGYETATISGKITGAIPGDVAVLLAMPFGAKSYQPTGMHLTLAPQATGDASYSFAVKPPLATRYKVEVLTGTTIDATSSARTVYVATGGFSKPIKVRCSRGHCTMTWKLGTRVPASAYRTEAAKKWFFYFALSRHTPTYMYLKKGATVSAPRKINAGTFVQTLTYHFSSRSPNPARSIQYEACTKDSEAKDGLGLPRHTGCGGRRLYGPVYAG